MFLYSNCCVNPRVYYDISKGLQLIRLWPTFFSSHVSKFSPVVFRALVLLPPHKRLLHRAPHSFPIVLLPNNPSQSQSRYCLTMSNQMAGYKGSFCLPRSCGAGNFLSTSGTASHGWNAKKKIECGNKCNVFTPSSAERVKIFGRSVVDLPRHITSYGSSGADLFVCTNCHKRLRRSTLFISSWKWE